MRVEQLTFTRFLAAISIVIFHYGTKGSLIDDQFLFIFRNANVGVSYFYILSGFVMIVAYGKKSHIDFYKYIKNRLARIYPVYFLAILTIFFIASIRIEDFILNIFMIQSWVPEKALTVNFTGWSISVEFFFYITFPFLLNKIYSKKRLRNITIFVLVFWLISQLLLHLLYYGKIPLMFYNMKDIFYHPIMHFNEFLIGNLTGLFFIQKKVKISSKYNSLMLIVMLLLLIFLLKYSFGLIFHNGLLAILFVPIILLISSNDSYIMKLISKKPFIFLGEISFGMYILQFPVWGFFSDYRMEKYFGLSKEAFYCENFFLRLFILIILSIISYLFFENPLRTKIKK